MFFKGLPVHNTDHNISYHCAAHHKLYAFLRSMLQYVVRLRNFRLLFALCRLAAAYRLPGPGCGCLLSAFLSYLLCCLPPRSTPWTVLSFIRPGRASCLFSLLFRATECSLVCCLLSIYCLLSYFLLPAVCILLYFLLSASYFLLPSCSVCAFSFANRAIELSGS